MFLRQLTGPRQQMSACHSFQLKRGKSGSPMAPWVTLVRTLPDIAGVSAVARILTSIEDQASALPHHGFGNEVAHRVLVLSQRGGQGHD